MKPLMLYSKTETTAAVPVLCFTMDLRPVKVAAESLCSFVRSTGWLVGRLMQMDSVIPELLTPFFAVTEIWHDTHAAKEFEVILTYLELLKAVIMKLGREEWNWVRIAKMI